MTGDAELGLQRASDLTDGNGRLTYELPVANAELADQCRQRARNSLDSDRPAWLCCAVLLQSSSTVAGAAKLLADIPVAEVRARAAQLLGELHERATP